MTRLVTALVVMFAVVSLSAQTKPAVPKAYEPLQGTWVLTGPDGQSVMGGAELALVITGDTYAQTVNGEVNERGGITLDPAKKPMWFDLSIKEGDDAGKTQLGIIEVTGDTLKGALSMPGATERPAGFDAGQSAITFVGKRKAK
ncbi:MAG TPA: TIGR03067 domain-containing protein [Vicinamibacterales bacterium]